MFATNSFAVISRSGDSATMPGMARRSAAPVSRRERPAKPALSRAGIVAAAVEIMQAEGLQRVTMRRLAQQLDTGAASLYVYVRSTAELHAAVLDELLGSVDLTAAADGTGWRERLLRVLGSYTQVLFGHPELARAALLTRLSGQRYLDLLETMLTLLREGGASDGQAAWGVDLLLLIATSTAVEQGARQQAPDAAAEEENLTAVLRGLPLGRYPRIAALGEDLLSGTPADRLTWVFTAAINGILGTAR